MWPMPASTDLAALNAPALQKFQTLLSQAVSEQCLTQLLLVAYQGTVPDIEALGSGLQRVSVRPVALRGVAHLSFLLRFPTKDITKNLPIDEALALLAGLMGPGVLTTCGETLAAPFGRIHWAGTETATRWAGYIDGAISSGERVADEVAGLG